MPLSASGPYWNLGSTSRMTWYWLQRGVHGRDDALAERVVERVVDGGGQDAVARGDFALDRDVEHRPGIELVGGDVGDAGDAP